MTLDELLRSAAQDVAAAAPDTYVAPAGIRSRARTAQRRQRAGFATGLAVVAAVVAIGLQATGGKDDAVEPVEPAPSPTVDTNPDTDTAPGVPVVEVPEITPDDLREYEVLATVTNAQPGNEGLTELTFEVPVRDRYTFEFSAFCVGDPDTWYVMVVGDGGASGSGYCDNPATDPFPLFPTDIDPLGHSGTASDTEVVRMFVVDEIPPQQQRCFDRKSPPECLDMEPQLEPLASTDVTFGISVYEYWAPPVTQVLGQDLAARTSIAGIDYLVSQVLTPGEGQHEFTTRLPAIEGDRLVGVLTSYRPAMAECQRAAGADPAANRACDATLELRIGSRIIPLVRGEDVGAVESMAGARFPHGLHRVPAGEQEIGLQVGAGDPDLIDFALVVLEETT